MVGLVGDELRRLREVETPAVVFVSTEGDRQGIQTVSDDAVRQNGAARGGDRSHGEAGDAFRERYDFALIGSIREAISTPPIPRMESKMRFEALIRLK